MRFSLIQTIYKKEMLDLRRDRRTMISMVAVPVLLFPALFQVITRVTSRMQEKSEQEVKTLGIAARVTTPSVREALAKTGIPLVERDDLPSAVEKKSVAAAVEEIPGTPPEIQVYVDSSNPTSTAAAEEIRTALTELRDREIRASLRSPEFRRAC